MAYRGKYKPINTSKYNGDPTQITYRSNLERKVMRYFDLHKDVLSWSSEEVIVPYRSPIDNRVHRYFVDFWVKMVDVDGNVKQLLIEVKPLAQCKEPVKKTRVTRRYLSEVQTWAVNKAKWSAAKSYSDSRGWRFVIMTEKEINGIAGI
ncbi:head completion protein [Stenotrophomonas phage vB_SmaS-DLP_6]|nr:head completion protein [Stenotrophomonas phage vB_SmaS-DLP_6]